MPLVSPSQLKRISAAIKQRVKAFTVEVYGKDSVTSKEYESLKNDGMVDEEASLIEDSFILGNHKAILDESEYGGLEEIPEHSSSTIDLKFIKHLVHEGLHNVQNLVRKIEKSIFNIILGENRNTFVEDVLQSENDATIMTISKVSEDLSTAGKEWKNDWKRDAATEMWNAKLHGMAKAIINKEGPFANLDGGDTLVAKIPAPDACPDCIEHYTDGEPIIFKLSELMRFGNNIGKKRNNWVPSLSPLHPNCRCELVVIPSGFHFENGELIPD